MPKDNDLLASVSDISTESEFFSPMPAGYKKGKTRYCFVMGTVMSGLGKGIFSSCLAKLMQDKGLKVTPIKLEGYLNIDSGTLKIWPLVAKFALLKFWSSILSYVPRSMSHSIPSSSTNTSPCRNGFMVPQSTLR